MRGLTVEGNTLAMNAQYPTNQGLIILDCSNHRVRIANNMFRNGRLAAIKRTQGVGGYAEISGNTFDRIKSNPLIDPDTNQPYYDQSLSMEGIDWAGGDIDVVGNRFLFMVRPIRMAPGEATAMTVQGNRFAGTNGPDQCEVKVDNANPGSSLTLQDNVPSPLLITNPQGAVPVFGERVGMGTATLAAGTVTVATTLVRASSRIRVDRQTDGGTVGASYSVTRNPGVGFTITAKDGAGATQALDSSTVSWTLELAGT